MKNPIAVYVMSLNTIGVIIDKGKDEFGTWYRTDSDGIREVDDLLFLYTKTDVKKCIKQLKAIIAPSTKLKLKL